VDVGEEVGAICEEVGGGVEALAGEEPGGQKAIREKITEGVVANGRGVLGIEQEANVAAVVAQGCVDLVVQFNDLGCVFTMEEPKFSMRGRGTANLSIELIKKALLAAIGCIFGDEAP